MPKLAYPLKWDQEGAGYTLTIDHGLGGASNIELAGCKVNAFAITPKQGGTVELKFRVQCNEGLLEATLGKLAMLVQHSVPIMLQAPDPGQQPEPELALGGVAQPKATPGRHKPRRSKRTAAHA